MGFLTICLIAGAITAIILSILEFIKDKDFFDFFFLGLIKLIICVLAGGALGIAIVFLFSSFFVTEKDLQLTEEKICNIIALNDNIIGERKSYIFSTTIDDDFYYCYLKENKDKGITQGKLKADNVYLRYIKNDDNDTSPRITHNYVIFKDSVSSLKRFFCLPMNDYSNNYYIIYVPEGSITNQFKVDLE